MTRVGWSAVAAAAVAVCIAGCGGGSNAPSGGPAAGSAGSPGCGRYCQQAGLPAGQEAPGYPCPQSGCLTCPPGGCVALRTRNAVASGDAIRVGLRCNLTGPCRGALLLCFPLASCDSSTRTAGGAGGRLAAADFSIPAGLTAATPVALTALGQRVARLDGGYRADVIVDLAGYGIVRATGAGASLSRTAMSHVSVLLSSAVPGPGVPGARVSCGGAPPLFADARANCRLAGASYRAWEQASRAARVRVRDPTTRRRLALRCAGASPVVCTGAGGGSVAFYA